MSVVVRVVALRTGFAIAHRFQSGFEHIGMKCDFEAVLVFGDSHCLESFCHPVGVAVVAAGRDLGTSGDGVPSGVSPFDF